MSENLLRWFWERCGKVKRVCTAALRRSIERGGFGLMRKIFAQIHKIIYIKSGQRKTERQKGRGARQRATRDEGEERRVKQRATREGGVEMQQVVRASGQNKRRKARKSGGESRKMMKKGKRPSYFFEGLRKTRERRGRSVRRGAGGLQTPKKAAEAGIKFPKYRKNGINTGKIAC